MFASKGEMTPPCGVPASASLDHAHIRVEIQPSADSVSLVVSDWGIGFDEGLDPEAFFVPRRRGRRAADQSVRGSGLGLASVERLVTAAGGTVRITHQAQPSSVTVRLPLAEPGRRHR